MAILCPYCDKRINLTDARPGRYRPRCPRCKKPFALSVFGLDRAATIRPLPTDSQGVVQTPAPSGLLPADLGTTMPGQQLPAVTAASPESQARLYGLAQTTPDPLRAGGAPAQHPIVSPSPNEEDEYPAPRTEIRGYRIERELGRGGMGAVYLARQLSLDRPVALKVMSKRWSADPVFVARFTREAYAAAQLCHPNIVQIYDIGEIDGARFFSMEYVPGPSLAEVLRTQGKLDPETAVGYVLQAARGLKHAHDRGMIHRDVKPDNLLLDPQGVIKVADLGLVKTQPHTRRHDALPGTRGGLNALPQDMTGARIALGTPAYMSPEQCRDAATVDHRADIYSLGCTLYVLVTGRPPFDGPTAVDVMTKHAYEPLVPPEEIVHRVPRELSAVIQRMMAKDPAARFQTMAEVIRTLEGWLGVRQAATFSPQDDQISRLEGFVVAFNTAPAAVLRDRLVQGFLAAAVLAVVLLTFFGRPGWASGVIGLVLQAGLAYFVLDGVTRKGPLFTRVRQFALGLSWGDWAVAIGGLVLFALLLWTFGLFWVWAGFGAIGFALAVGLKYGLDRAADAQRRAPLEGCEKLLRRLRAQGLDEEDLRQFVAKFAGRHWEEFFEAVFGYEAKLAARAALQRGAAAGEREKFAAWREPLIAAIERVERTRKEARERQLLQALEHARLLAAGLTEAAARVRAEAAVTAMVREADRIRREEAERAGTGHQPFPPTTVSALARGSSNPDFAIDPPAPDPLKKAVGLFVGPHVRAVLAAALLAGCGLWAHQNGFVPGAAAGEQAARAVEAQDLSGLKEAAAFDARRPTRPLEIAGVPGSLTAWADSFNVGYAGLLLLASLLYRGNRMGVFVLLGAAVTLAGHKLGIRTVEPFRDFHVALILGSVLALVGFRVGSR